KLQSRRSALKGGFTAKVVLPAEVEAEATRLADELETTFRPRDAWERHLVRDVLAVEMIQLKRHDRRVAEAETEQMERATSTGADDRRDEVEALANRLAIDPGRTVSRLYRTLHGAGWLREAWIGLGLVLEEGGTWTTEQRSLALDLLAVPLVLRDGPTM